MLNKSFDTCDDKYLVIAAKNGDNEAMAALVAKLLPLIRKTAIRSVTGCNIDCEDLIQEGLIGLLSAVRSFDQEKEATFITYASVCISNSIRSAVRKTKTGKEIPDKEIISIDDASSLCSDRLFDPQNLIIENEEVQRLKNRLDKQLSDTEQKVLKLYLFGDSYSVIAKKLLLSNEKAVDNALQRIRKKLKSFS